MNFRTDLAVEATAHLHDNLPNGVQVRNTTEDSIAISSVIIETEEAAKALGKEIGQYITITVDPFYAAARYSQQEIEVIAKQISLLVKGRTPALVIGLGNEQITPDAIGPLTIEQILATRHISPELAKQSGLEMLRPVCALAPGVLGQTGIESAEIIKALVDRIHPGVVIVIDAFAARESNRVGSTVQISDSGISPGSGVLNTRAQISEKSLGVPVIAIGVPTVIDATTLASDLLRHTPDKAEAFANQYEAQGHPMMVTPKEIDLLVEKAAQILSMSINRALQPDLSVEDITYLVN